VSLPADTLSDLQQAQQNGNLPGLLPGRLPPQLTTTGSEVTYGI